MQPVTASVPASARARSRASADAAWSTSAAARWSAGSSNASGRRRDEDDDRLDLPAHRQWRQQRAAGAARDRQPRHAGRQFAPPDGEHALPGARDPRHPGRTLRAWLDVAEAPLALEQVHHHQLALPLGGEVVDVHLVGREGPQI